MGFAEIMKDEIMGPIGNAQYKGYAGDIHASGEHLLKLINEILDLSRIEAGKYELAEKPVDFGSVARECLHLMRLDAQAKSLRLVTTFKPEMPHVFGDERALRQICLNLLANAIKFTPEQGTIALSTGMKPTGEPYLTVRDNGPGIPEDEIPTVLAAFGQGSEAKKIGAAGTGLGLPIVAGLAELHGGRFQLRSKPGVGTEATLLMPKSRVLPESASTNATQAACRGYRHALSRHPRRRRLRANNAAPETNGRAATRRASKVLRMQEPGRKSQAKAQKKRSPISRFQ